MSRSRLDFSIDHCSQIPDRLPLLHRLGQAHVQRLVLSEDGGDVEHRPPNLAIGLELRELLGTRQQAVQSSQKPYQLSTLPTLRARNMESSCMTSPIPPSACPNRRYSVTTPANATQLCTSSGRPEDGRSRGRAWSVSQVQGMQNGRGLRADR